MSIIGKHEQELLQLVEEYNAEIVKACRIKGFAVNFIPITLEVNGYYEQGRYGRSYNLYISPEAFRFFKSNANNLRNTATNRDYLLPKEILKKHHSFSGLQREEAFRRLKTLKNDLMLLIVKLRKSTSRIMSP